MNEGTVRGTFDLNVPAFAKVRALRREAQTLERTLERLGRMRVRPVVELTGITRARQEVALLRRELESLERLSVGVGAGGGGRGGTAAAAFAGAAGGRGGGRGGAIRTLDFGPLSLSPRAWPVLAGVGLPAIQSLIGATGALAGTMTGAGMVGGATALAGGGALATGIGTITAVARPATKAIGEAREAQDKYNEAIDRYGRGSTQAVAAAYEMNRAFQQAPRGTRRLIQDAREFERAWTRATRVARTNVVGFYREGIGIGRRATPVLGPAAGRTTGALRRETRMFGQGVFGRPGTDVQRSIGGQFVGQSAAMFDENLVQARRFGVFGSTAMMQLSIAARPFLLDATRFMANWSRGWASSTSNIGEVRRNLGQMVPYVRSIRRFMFAGGRLVFHTIMQGAPSGRSMLDQLTEQLREWDRWVQRNPHQVRSFFRETVDATIQMARALFRIGRELARIGDALLPVLDRFSQLVSLAGDIGLLQPGALALGIGAWRGGRAGAKGARGGLSPAQAAIGGVAAGRASRAGGILRGGVGGALRGAGRAAWPVALGFGLLDAATFQGNVGQRLGAGLSGASFGIFPAPRTNAMVAAERLAKVQGFAQGVPQGLAGIERLRERGSRIRARMARPDVSPEMTRMVNEQLREELKVVNGHLRERIRAWREFADARAATLGERRAGRFQQAFGVRAARQGPERALTRTGGDVLQEMQGMRREGARILGQNTLAWAREAANRNPELVDEYRQLRRQVVGHFRGMGDEVALVNGRILIGTRRIWSNVRRSLVDPVEQARQEVTRGFTEIQRRAIGALLGMGFSRGEASNLVRNAERGGVRGSAARSMISTAGGSAGARGFGGHRQSVRDLATGSGGTRAFGGRLTGGRGLSDSIALGGGVKAARGELVVNRHTERDVSRDLMMAGKPSLDWRVRHEHRRHSISTDPTRSGLPHGGIGMHALGGRLRMAMAAYGARTVGGYPDAMGALPGLDALAAIIAQRFGLRVVSGLRPGAITTSGNPSDHGWGGAVDLSNGARPTPQMDAASRWLARMAGGTFSAGVFSGGPIKQMIYRSMVGGNHFNHIHVALSQAFAHNAAAVARWLGGGGGGRFGGAGFGGMAGPQLGRIPVPGSRLGGVPGGLSGRAQEVYAAGLRRMVNRRLASGRFGAGGLAGAAAGGALGSTLTKGQLARLWVQAGGPPNLANLMAAIALAESGGRASVVNSIGATGPWQINWPVHAARFPGMNPKNPRHNASMAVSIFRSQGLGAWEAYTRGMHQQFMATGGRMPPFGGWFGRGGVGFARRPTMIGVGDRPGGEHFSVRPWAPRRARGGGGGGGGRSIGALHVHYHGPVHVRSQADIDQITEKVAEKVIDALDDGRGDERLGGDGE